jgi:hypothetical protein
MSTTNASKKRRIGDNESLISLPKKNTLESSRSKSKTESRNFRLEKNELRSS